MFIKYVIENQKVIQTLLYCYCYLLLLFTLNSHSTYNRLHAAFIIIDLYSFFFSISQFHDPHNITLAVFIA